MQYKQTDLEKKLEMLIKNKKYQALLVYWFTVIKGTSTDI